MGLSDKLKNLGDKAKESAAEHRWDAQDVEVVGGREHADDALRRAWPAVLGDPEGE